MPQQPDPFLASIEESLAAATEAPPAPDNPAFEYRMSLYCRLSQLLRRLEEQTKEVKEKMAALEPQLLLDMTASGMERCSYHGLTVFQRTDRWVRKLPDKAGVTTEMICDALRAVGRGDMVADSYSASSLKALVVEFQKDGKEVPQELAQLLDIGSKVVLGTQKS